VTEQVIAIARCVSWALMPQTCISGCPLEGAYTAPSDSLAGFGGAARLLMLIKVPVCFNLVFIYIYVLESPWKVLEFDFDKWARTVVELLHSTLREYPMICTIYLVMSLSRMMI